MEEQFKLSWDDTEQIFSQPELLDFFPEKPAMFKFIKELRDKGYDKVFRADQCLFGFVLSRSREHGLRTNQAHIMFEITSDGMDVTKFNFTQNGSLNRIHLKEKKLVPEIEKLLNELKEHSID